MFSFQLLKQDDLFPKRTFLKLEGLGSDQYISCQLQAAHYLKVLTFGLKQLITSLKNVI